MKNNADSILTRFSGNLTAQTFCMTLVAAILLLLFTHTGCARKIEMNKPDPFISMKNMESVMVECYLLEAAMRVFETNDTIDMEKYGQQQWKKLMEKYGLTTQNWQENYSYYISKPQLRDTLMKHIGDKLTELEAAEEVNLKNFHTNPKHLEKRIFEEKAPPGQMKKEEQIIE